VFIVKNILLLNICVNLVGIKVPYWMWMGGAFTVLMKLKAWEFAPDVHGRPCFLFKELEYLILELPFLQY
jgi:hypothetical protein